MQENECGLSVAKYISKKLKLSQGCDLFLIEFWFKAHHSAKYEEHEEWHNLGIYKSDSTQYLYAVNLNRFSSANF